MLLALCALIVFFSTLGQATGYLEVGFQPSLVQLIFGYSFYFLGLFTILISQHQMGNAWRIGVRPNEKTTLITGGFFKYVRNPIYSGLFLGGIGLWLISPGFILLAGLLTGYAAIELFVRKVEEPYLQEQFGQIYTKWCNTTPRYIPKIASH